MMNRVFIEPNLGMGYPIEDAVMLRPILRAIRPGDDEAITVDFDFLGAQYYTTTLAVPVPGLGGVPRRGTDRRHYDVNQMGLNVKPEGLYRALLRLHEYGRFGSIVVTENGMCVPDELESDRVHDVRRVDYFRRHLAQVRRAQIDGIPVDGYFAWSFLDNFEWAEGYAPRFGVVYVDYPTQRRIVKDSGYWFQQLLTGENTTGRPIAG